MSLSDNWNVWVAKNLANGVKPSEIIKTMTENNIFEMDAIECIYKIQSNPFFLELKNLQKKYDKICSVVANLQKLKEQNPKYNKIQKIELPSKDEFFKNYWLTNTPVIIKNVSENWKAKDNWTFKNLSAKYGNEFVEIQENRNQDFQYELNSIAHKKKVLLQDFIERILSCESSNDFYMTANNHAIDKTNLKNLMADIGTLPEFIKSNMDMEGFWHIWIGPKGTLTPLHHDETALLHTQIVGRKKWLLISPLEIDNLANHRAVFSEIDIFNIDYNKFPKIKNVKIIEAIVEPGETIFLPLGWWHAVESLDRSISTSFLNFVFPNTWEFKNP